MSVDAEAIGFTALAGEDFLSITTFRRDGTEASTPVWFVSDDLTKRLFVATGGNTWKVRRIERNPHVRVAACNARGKVTGSPIDGIARRVEEGALVRVLQAEKYGWKKWLAEKASGFTRLVTRKPPEEAVFLEIVPLANAVEPKARAA